VQPDVLAVQLEVSVEIAAVPAIDGLRECFLWGGHEAIFAVTA
jgi:hypothetical protein